MILTGDNRETLKTIPAGSVDCCVTSPPYWGLRDYGTAQWEGGDVDCDHRQPASRQSGSTLQGGKKTTGHAEEGYRDTCGKCGATRIDSQIGLEKTPAEFVATMVQVFREVRRVLADHGTCFLNLGDSMHNKRMACIPWRVAMALQDDGWWLRQDIIWAKPAPMPSSVKDRCTTAHEYIFLLTKQPRYYWDWYGISEKTAESTDSRLSQDVQSQVGSDRQPGKINGNMKAVGADRRNKRSVWTINTVSYSGAHFAVYPPELAQNCILAGCPEKYA